MLSLRNKRESFNLLNTPVVLFILIIITILRIYSLHISPIELSVDEAQYWHWSRNIDFGYFTKPPFIAWMIAFSTLIFGNEEWAIRLFSPITHLLISLVFFDSVDEETIKTFLTSNLFISLSIASKDGVSQITRSKGLYV